MRGCQFTRLRGESRLRPSCTVDRKRPSGRMLKMTTTSTTPTKVSSLELT